MSELLNDELNEELVVTDEEELKEEELKEEEEPEKEEKEKDELDEIEEDLKEPDEDNLELTTPVKRREILAKYPQLFKDFPYLEKAYYREQQFTELIPTIDDAREAVSKANTLDRFESDLSRGNIETTLKAIKSGEGFEQMVDNLLPTLASIDKDAYIHVTGNIIRTTVMNMINYAKEKNNEEVMEAARILNELVFGTTKIEEPKNLAKPRDDSKQELENERIAIVQEQFENVRDELSNTLNNVVKGLISSNIDPNDSMSNWTKKNAIRDCHEKLESLLSNDKRLQAVIDKLWENAFRSRFSKPSKDQIKSAWISRAKSLLPAVLKQARNEALKGAGKRSNDEDDTPKKGPVPVGGPKKVMGNKNNSQKSKEIPAGVSTLDFLMSDD